MKEELFLYFDEEEAKIILSMVNFLKEFNLFKEKDAKLDGIIKKISDSVFSLDNEDLVDIQAKFKENFLDQSYSKLVSSFEIAEEGITISIDENIRYANPAFIRLLGYDSLDNVLSLGFLNMISKQYYQKIKNYFENRLKGEIVPNIYDIELIRADGSKILIDCVNYCMPFQDRNLLVTFYISLKNLKNLEIKLRKSEEVSRNILDNSSFLIYQFNLKTNLFGYISPSSIRMLGYSPEELVSLELKRLIDLIHPEDKERFQKHFDNLIKQDTEKELNSFIEYRFKHKILDYRWFDSHHSIIFDNMHNPISIVGNVRDITKSKSTEEEHSLINKELVETLSKKSMELQETLQNYKTLIDVTNTGYLVIDEKGLVLYANPVYVRMSGHRLLKEILGRSIIEWTTDYLKDEITQKLMKCTTQGSLGTLNADYKDKDGKIIMIEINTDIYKTEEGLRIIGICHDVTKFKLAEQKLKESEEKLKKSEKKLRKLNKELEEKVLARTEELKESENDLRILNRELEQEIEKRTREIRELAKFPSENPNAVLRVSEKRVLYTNDVAKYLFNIQKGSNIPHLLQEYVKDSLSNDKKLMIDLEISDRIYSFSVNPIEGTSYVNLYGRDITDRKKAEEALKASEIMLQKSQEIGHIGSFEMDLATNEVVWSDQLYKLFGLKKEGRTINYEKVLALIHPDDRERAIKVSNDAAKERKSYTLEHRVIHLNGKILDLLITGDVIRNEKNEVVKIGGTTQDITERKKAGNKLIEAQEQLIRHGKLVTIGKLAGSIGHELRNPLGVINNSIYYLNMKLKDIDIDEKVKKHLKIMQEEVMTSNSIISNILEFSKIRNPLLEKIDINVILEEVADNISIPDNIILEQQFNTKIPTLLLDLFQIKLAIRNIVLNAVQAMSDGGKLQIKSKTSGNMVKIIFKDTGKGITKENLPKIFGPLFSTKVKGIGLGLSMVKDVIEKHDGFVKVDSEVDVGTTFTISLPLNRKE